MNRQFKLPTRTQALFNTIKEFQIIAKLGEGGFSKVYKAVHKISEATYAIKVVNFNRLNILDQENIEKEIYAHKVMNHKNVVRLYDFFKEDNIVYLVMEYCSGGNLFHYINKKHPLTVDEIQKLFKQTVDGIDYIHKKGFINRDIKPENILLDSFNNIKICDFGWASHKNDDNYLKLKAGTISYMSPECLKGQHQDASTDIWSLGVLLYELFNNKEPFSGISCSDQLKKIEANSLIYLRTDVPQSVKLLIKSLMTIDKSKRMKIEDIYRNEFLSNYELEQRKEDLIKPKKVYKSSVSVHSYNEPLHGTYDVNPKSVSTIHSKNSGYSSYFNNLAKVSNRSSRKNILPIQNALPLKNSGDKKQNLVSCRIVDKVGPPVVTERMNRYILRGAKAVKDLNLRNTSISSISSFESISRPASPNITYTVRRNPQVVQSFSQTININPPPPQSTRISTICTTTETDDWIIKDYKTYKKRYLKTSSSVCIAPERRIETPIEIKGVVRDIKRNYTPVITKTYERETRSFLNTNNSKISNNFGPKIISRRIRTADYVEQLANDPRFNLNYFKA